MSSLLNTSAGACHGCSDRGGGLSSFIPLWSLLLLLLLLLRSLLLLLLLSSLLLRVSVASEHHEGDGASGGWGGWPGPPSSRGTLPASSPLLFPPSAWVPLLLLVSVLLSRRLALLTTAAHGACVPECSAAAHSQVGGVHSRDGCHSAATASPSSCKIPPVTLHGLPAKLNPFQTTH